MNEKIRHITVIIPTSNTYDLVKTAIMAHEAYHDKNKYLLDYIVVENSSNECDKIKIEQLNDRVKFILNDVNFHEQFKDQPHAMQNVGSFYNASGCEIGIHAAKSEFVFLSHNDALPCSHYFWDTVFEKFDEGFTLIGMIQDPGRIKAAHCSGLFTTLKFATEVTRKYTLFPRYMHSYPMNIPNNEIVQVWDACDALSFHGRKTKGIKEFIFENTQNDKSLASINSNHQDNIKFKSLHPHVSRCYDRTGRIIYLHCGRGTYKSRGVYAKKNKKNNILDWFEFIETSLGVELKFEVEKQ
jgi:hypothetical protein